MLPMLSQKKSTTIFDYAGLHLSFVQDFILWWYVDIPTYLLGILKRINIVLLDSTSLPIILKGYLKPWRNDYNIAGWVVGMFLKTVYIPVAGFVVIVANGALLLVILLQLILLPLIIAMILLNPFLVP